MNKAEDVPAVLPKVQAASDGVVVEVMEGLQEALAMSISRVHFATYMTAVAWHGWSSHTGSLTLRIFSTSCLNLNICVLCGSGCCQRILGMMPASWDVMAAKADAKYMKSRCTT